MKKATLKRTFRILSLAALTFMGAVMTGCSSDNNIIDEPQLQKQVINLFYTKKETP